MDKALFTQKGADMEAPKRGEMDEEIVNIEEIMQHIRAQIIARKTAESPDSHPHIKLTGKHLPPEFYEHLYHINLLYNEIDVPLHLTPTNTPLVGSILHRIRQALHQIVLLYVNRMAKKQIDINKYLLHMLNDFGEEVEKLIEKARKES